MKVRAGRGGFTLVGAACLLAGCAAGGGGDPPRRPAVAVADEVGAVDRDLVVGTWRCRELNPYPEMPALTIATTYEADGTFVSETQAAPRPPLGAVRSKARGRWSAEGGQIATTDVTTEAGSADGDAWTDLMARATASVINTFNIDQPRATGEVLQLDRRQLVMRPLGVEDPPVISCAR